MAFQYNKSRNQTNLDMNDRSILVYPEVFTDPRDTLKQNTIKPKKDFSIFRKPTLNNFDINNKERSINIFTRGMIEKINGPANNCSSCGGAK